MDWEGIAAAVYPDEHCRRMECIRKDVVLEEEGRKTYQTAIDSSNVFEA